MDTTITLPDELAPSLRSRVIDLITQVTPLELAPRYPLHIVPQPEPYRCTICHRRGGKLGGHHLPDGSIGWVHRTCHRRHHRAERRPALATA
jgi:hypothetical protein